MSNLFKKCLSVITSLGLIVSSCPALTVNATAQAQITSSLSVSPVSICADETATVNLTLTGIPYEQKVVPNDVILVIDRSGSMSNAMDDMIEAAIGFVENVNLNKHNIGVVAYESTAVGTALSSNQTDIVNTIGAIYSSGGTDIAAGINKAVELLENKRTDTIGSIVLMTDGYGSDVAAEIAAADHAKSLGYVFYTVALCPSEASTQNENLKKMATSEADHYSVFASSGLSQVYDDIAEKIGKSYARNVILTQEISDEFEYVEGSADTNVPQPTISGNTLTWNMNQLGKGTVNLSYQLRAKADTAFGTYPHASGEVTYINYENDTVTTELASYDIEFRPCSPKITSVTPKVYDGESSATVTLKGKHFYAGSKVYLDDVEMTDASISSEELITFTAPAKDDGTYTIKVVSPDDLTGTATIKVGPLPKVTAVTPASGPAGKVNLVTIAGENFAGTYKNLNVFAGNTQATVVSVSPTEIVCKFPAMNVGVYDIKVVNSDGGEGFLNDGFTCYAEDSGTDALTITDINPDTIEENTIVPVTITGTGFTGTYKTLDVTVGGVAATVTTVASDGTTIKCKAPALAAGVYDVVVTTSDGSTKTVVNAIEYTAVASDPDPVITSVSPSALEENVSGKITITGTDFRGTYKTVKVTVGGKSATVSTVSDTQIICTAPAMAAGTYTVTVTNDDGTTGSKVDALTYTAPPEEPDGPTVTSINPDVVAANKVTLVTITGTDFKGTYKTLTVTVNGVKATVSTVTSTSVKCKVPKLAAGTYTVVVTNSDGGSDTVANGITYGSGDSATAPVITKIDPDTIPENTVCAAVITGTNFKGSYKTLKVTVGGTAATVVTVAADGTSINCKFPSKAAGTYDVVVTNSDGETTATPGSVVYASENAGNEKPVITDINPSEVEAEKVTLVTITGTNFNGTYKTLKVTVDGVNATVVTVASDGTTITCKVPALTAGTYDVYVVNSDGETNDTPASITYEGDTASAKPTITSIDSNTVEAEAVTLVTITGTNFSGTYKTLKVTVDGTAATVVSVASDGTTITCKVPALAAGTYDVYVVNSDGETNDTPASITYEGDTVVQTKPTITDVNPDTVEADAVTLVTITGTNFSGTYKTLGVTVNGTAATVVSVSSDGTTITCKVPALAAGTYDVYVVNSDNTTNDTPASITYEGDTASVKPTITSIDSNTVEADAVTLVTITGANFSGTYKTLGVTVDGTAATVVSVASDGTTITCKVPALAAGTYDVYVVNSDGETNDTPASITYEGVTASVKPTITGIDSNTVEADVVTSVTITGANFNGTYKTLGVTVNGTAATVVSVSSDGTTITCKVPALAAGTYDVYVINSDGETNDTPASITYEGDTATEAEPTITNIDPGTVTAKAVTLVTITGTNFKGTYKTLKITVNGTAATVVTVATDGTMVTCKVPKLAAGTYDLVLTNADNTSCTYRITYA